MNSKAYVIFRAEKDLEEKAGRFCTNRAKLERRQVTGFNGNGKALVAGQRNSRKELTTPLRKRGQEEAVGCVLSLQT